MKGMKQKPYQNSKMWQKNSLNNNQKKDKIWKQIKAKNKYKIK